MNLSQGSTDLLFSCKNVAQPQGRLFLFTIYATCNSLGLVMQRVFNRNNFKVFFYQFLKYLV